jgi:hypothetical protein
MSSLGILGLDICASISYKGKTGTVHAFLQGCSRSEQGEVKRRLEDAQPRGLGEHPLFLPLILAEVKREIIHQEGRDLWELLLRVETHSGQTGAPAYTHDDSFNMLPAAFSDIDFDWITRDVLGVIQRVTYAETHANALLLAAAEMNRSVKAVNKATTRSRKELIAKLGNHITERLELLMHQIKVMQGDAQFLLKRAEAQQTAVSAACLS